MLRGDVFTTTSTDLVTETCCNCGIWFAMPRPLYNQRRRDGENFTCPNGHKQHYTDTDTVKLRRLEAQLTSTKDQLQAARDEGEQTRRTLVRERARFAAGVCPFCNRSFTAVRRHIETKHPDYDVTRLDGATTATFRCTCGFRSKTYHGLRVHQGRSSWGRHETKV